MSKRIVFNYLLNRGIGPLRPFWIEANRKSQSLVAEGLKLLFLAKSKPVDMT